MRAEKWCPKLLSTLLKCLPISNPSNAICAKTLTLEIELKQGFVAQVIKNIYPCTISPRFNYPFPISGKNKKIADLLMKGNLYKVNETTEIWLVVGTFYLPLHCNLIKNNNFFACPLESESRPVQFTSSFQALWRNDRPWRVIGWGVVHEEGSDWLRWVVFYDFYTAICPNSHHSPSRVIFRNNRKANEV